MIKKVAQNKKQKMTIDKLAQMVEKLSQTTEKGFSNLEIKLKKDFEEKTDKLARITVNEFSIMDKRILIMDSKIQSSEIKIDRLRRELDDLKEKMKKRIDKMLTIADSMTSQFSHWKEENAFSTGIESRQDDELKDHEKRIVKIEQKIEV